MGKTYDCSNSIIIGNNFTSIDTPNSIISNSGLSVAGAAGRNVITDPSGSNIVFGQSNTLNYSSESFIMGDLNTIDNSNNLVNYKGGNMILGKSNIINNNIGGMADVGGTSNVIIGELNNMYYSANSFIQGNNNNCYGSLNVIFGKGNIIGKDTGVVEPDPRVYTANDCIILGQSNTLLSPSGEVVQNSILIGTNNKLDLSDNTWTEHPGLTDAPHAYVLIGAHADISNTNVDSSNVRLAFGTFEKYDQRSLVARDRFGGNVFTIDVSGNTHIHGNLIVDGSQVIFRTDHYDVSDNNMTLNYPGNNDAQGGGFTIMDTTGGDKHWKWTDNYGGAGGPPGANGKGGCWVTTVDAGSGYGGGVSDLSINNLFANNIHGTTHHGSASFSDISAIDISCIDISCVDISAVNFFSVGGASFHGNLVHLRDESTFNDISCC